MENTEKKQHQCKYNSLIIDNTKCYGSDIVTSYQTISVSIDCECIGSEPLPLIQFFDTPLFTAEKLFFAWFSEVAPWFIQQGYKIVDNRKSKMCNNED